MYQRLDRKECQVAVSRQLISKRPSRHVARRPRCGRRRRPRLLPAPPRLLLLMQQVEAELPGLQSNAGCAASVAARCCVDRLAEGGDSRDGGGADGHLPLIALQVCACWEKGRKGMRGSRGKGARGRGGLIWRPQKPDGRPDTKLRVLRCCIAAVTQRKLWQRARGRQRCRQASSPSSVAAPAHPRPPPLQGLQTGAGAPCDAGWQAARCLRARGAAGARDGLLRPAAVRGAVPAHCEHRRGPASLQCRCALRRQSLPGGL